MHNDPDVLRNIVQLNLRGGELARRAGREGGDATRGVRGDAA